MGEIQNVSFMLTDEHIKTTCKPGSGKEACRYLAVDQTGLICAKFGSLMETINERVSKNQMTAQGDNCGGLLGEIMKAKDEFIGKKVEYKERNPEYQMLGIVKDLIFIEEKSFTIRIDDSENLFSYGINVKSLSITKSDDYFKFEISGLGHFGGSAKIFN